MKIRGRRYIAPVILNLGTSWRRVVNFTSQPSELWERVSVPIDRSLGGLEHFGEGKERHIRILVATASISYK